jgi:hypothetical protein
LRRLSGWLSEQARAKLLDLEGSRRFGFLEKRLPTLCRDGAIVRISNRRNFFGALAVLAPAAASAKDRARRSETVYRFLTPDYEGRLSVHYLDNYSSAGFWFSDRLSGRRFCLSEKGEEGRDCLADFKGALAIAVYHLRSLPHSRKSLKLRERVLTIDHDSRMDPRPPFETTLDGKGEVVSDIQAFGYNRQNPAEPAPLDPWCLLRQDLYFEGHDAPFLIIHWKHTFSAITLIDVIPGERTKLVDV